ncbi:orotate phosphoribosyltransferase [bacterium]|nr:orotate phosphoribosyltransferase [bacterium]
MKKKNNTARLLLRNNIVGLIEGEPVLFKSGILAPVYVDNRKLPAHPLVWQKIIKAMADMVKRKEIKFDIIAGIETAGIPHSAALSFILKKPSVFVRKEAKGHGLKKRVEGGDVSGKRILLIEDLVSTGGSSLSGVQALKDEGATVTDCLVIVNYDFRETGPNFKKAKVHLHALATFAQIADEAATMKFFTKEQSREIKNWLKDPWGWTKKHETKV